MTAVTFITPLSPQDCTTRLKANIDSGWAPFGTTPVRGSVGDTRFQLRKRIRYNNSFQTCCYGRLETSGSGTLIHCRFGLNRFAIVFMVIWFGFFAAITAGFILGLATYQPSGASNETVAGFPVFLIAMPVFGVAAILFGRYLARDEQGFLSDFICAVLDAKVTDQGLREPAVKR